MLGKQFFYIYIYIYLVLSVNSTKLPLGLTLNNATRDVYTCTPKTAETLIHGNFNVTDIVF